MFDQLCVHLSVLRCRGSLVSQTDVRVAPACACPSRAVKAASAHSPGAVAQTGVSSSPRGGTKVNLRPKSGKQTQQYTRRRRQEAAEYAAEYGGLEAEELLQVVVRLKESMREYDRERQAMRVELARLQKECQKQQTQLTKLLSSHAYVHGSTLTEIRHDIEKSTLVRQLKAQVYQLRSELVAKQAELDTLRKSQRACHLVELAAENEEYLHEIQRLQKVATGLAEELRKERHDRKLEREGFASSESKLRCEITRLTNEVNKLAAALDAQQSPTRPEQSQKQERQQPREQRETHHQSAENGKGGAKGVTTMTATAGPATHPAKKRERPKSATVRSSAPLNGVMDGASHKTEAAAPTAKPVQRPRSAVSRTAKTVGSARQSKDAPVSAVYGNGASNSKNNNSNDHRHQHRDSEKQQPHQPQEDPSRKKSPRQVRTSSQSATEPGQDEKGAGLTPTNNANSSNATHESEAPSHPQPERNSEPSTDQVVEVAAESVVQTAPASAVESTPTEAAGVEPPRQRQHSAEETAQEDRPCRQEPEQHVSSTAPPPLHTDPDPPSVPATAEASEGSEARDVRTASDSTDAVEATSAALTNMESDPDLQHLLDGLGDDSNDDNEKEERDEDGRPTAEGDREPDADGQSKAEIEEGSDDEQEDERLDALLREVDAVVSSDRDGTVDEQPPSGSIEPTHQEQHEQRQKQDHEGEQAAVADADEDEDDYEADFDD